MGQRTPQREAEGGGVGDSLPGDGLDEGVHAVGAGGVGALDLLGLDQAGHLRLAREVDHELGAPR
jgi:hypothetical protein